jgi:thiol-disulfide isomerase/thioredoxin
LLFVFMAAALSAVVSLPASAQNDRAADDSACQAGALNLASTGGSETADAEAAQAASGGAPEAYRVPVASDRPAVEVTPKTSAESRVQERIGQDGVHVVHFWAPWCPNAKSELESGWSRLVQNNPDVSFVFVNIWNDAEPGSSLLNRYDLPTDRIVTLQQPDLGPSDQEANRRKTFLGIPVTWTPSTWIFHNRGELAFAMNYGEMEMKTIQALLDATQKDW